MSDTVYSVDEQEFHDEDPEQGTMGYDFVGSRLAVEPKQGIGKLKLVSI
jgi:hypothetical protein